MSTRDRIQPSDFHIFDRCLTYETPRSLFGNYLFIPRMTPSTLSPIFPSKYRSHESPVHECHVRKWGYDKYKIYCLPEEGGQGGPWKCWAQVLHSRLRRSADRKPIISHDRRCSRGTLNFAFRRRRIEFSRATMQTFYTRAPHAVSKKCWGTSSKGYSILA